MGARWIKISIVYLVIGVLFGLFMHYTVQLEWAATHAHINVVGWLSTGLIGVIYSIYKNAAGTKLAIWQFWLHNIGLPILLIGMLFVPLLDSIPFWLFEVFVSGGGLAFALSIILFLINIFQNVRG